MTSTSVDFSVDAPKPWAIRPRATGTCAEHDWTNAARDTPRVDGTRSSPPLYERHMPVASTARSYTPLPRTGGLVFWRKISRLPPRRRRLRANTRGDGVRGGGGASVRSRSPRGGLRLGGLAPSKASLVRLRPRATLLDAGEKAATCLAPLVQTSNASPPAFLEDFWRTRAHSSRVFPLAPPASSRAHDRNWC